MGICGLSIFLNQKASSEGSTLEQYLNAIDYVVNLVGIEYVGIGLSIGYKHTEEEARESLREFPEFGTYGPLKHRYTRELKDASNRDVLTKGLVARGYSNREINKIMGENYIRVYK